MGNIGGHDGQPEKNGQPGFKLETMRGNRSEWMIIVDIC